MHGGYYVTTPRGIDWREEDDKLQKEVGVLPVWSERICHKLAENPPTPEEWQWILDNKLLIFKAIGSTILHPHLQVIGDPITTNEMEWLLDASSSYYQRNGTLYWKDLIRIEKGLGKRYIAQFGNVHWFVSFAPIGFNEVCGSVEGHGSITTFGKEEVASLAKGIVSTLKYYYEKDLNSFNFSIYSISGEPHYQLLIRIIPELLFNPITLTIVPLLKYSSQIDRQYYPRGTLS